MTNTNWKPDFENHRCSYLYRYIKDMIQEGSWDYDCGRNQIKSVFTTICLIDNIDVSTNVYDNMIQDLYNAIEEGKPYNYDTTYDSFDLFMGEYLA